MYLASRIFVLLTTLSLGACGGGDEPERLPVGPVGIINYAVPKSTTVSYVANNYEPKYDFLIVTPILAEEEQGVDKVELRLFGYEPQVMTEANIAPKAGLMVLKYRFAMPATFRERGYPCDTGQHESEVRVTNGLGAVTTIRFELCPGVDFEKQADLPQ